MVENAIDESIKIFACTVYMTLFLCNMLTSYFFWVSKDGELRIIMIRKYLAGAIVFGCFSVMCFVMPAVSLKWASLFCVPYLYVNILLIRYLVKSVKSA